MTFDYQKVAEILPGLPASEPIVLELKLGLNGCQPCTDKRVPKKKLKALRLPVRDQHDLTDHASASQCFVCLSGLTKRQPLCDQRLDLLLLQ